ncbi:YqzL family protein [Bacillus aerolatus]|uniref:YqzL family protein n=1 Tax=Bacillus aerolatus TaxID=2653354 RepID=A0A6I1FZC1_9BACI|nr:YqzL family protein [Bacillus aerolatus]KAB7708736.1 YqzL family protein [Bacillus aerolatus]
MLDLTWKVFLETGSVEVYLLYKEIEKDNENSPFEQEHRLAGLDFPVTRMTN